MVVFTVKVSESFAFFQEVQDQHCRCYLQICNEMFWIGNDSPLRF